MLKVRLKMETAMFAAETFENLHSTRLFPESRSQDRQRLGRDFTQGSVQYVKPLQAVFGLVNKHGLIVLLTASSGAEVSGTYLKQKKIVTDNGQKYSSYALHTS
jgi:hypothetical protein